MTDVKRETLLVCDYGVFAENEEGVENCGEPAIARWTWDGGKTWLYVCPDHDDVVDKGEEEPDEIGEAAKEIDRLRTDANLACADLAEANRTIAELREQVKAADKLVTELAEACQMGLMWVEGDEATHGRKFGTGNTLRAALARKAQGDAK